MASERPSAKPSLFSRLIPHGIRRLMGAGGAAKAGAEAARGKDGKDGEHGGRGRRRGHGRRRGTRRTEAETRGEAGGREYQLVDTEGRMPAFLAELERAEEVFLDTEADNMYHFKMRVCLLQFLLNGRVWLVDAQAPLDLAPLWRLLARKHLVMHGCDFDLRLLHALCGFEPESVFDTMLAAQLLNRPRVGLASLIEQHFGGVEMDKKCQRANWSERPFTRRLLDYAAGDVVYLPGLRDLLAGELRALGRLGWLEQQCRQQIQSAKEGFPEADENAWRIGRSERLRGRGLGVLHAVWHWRQKWAERLDVPPFKVCGNDLLLRLAAAAENGADAAGVLGGVHLGRRHDRLSPGLREAVAAGLAADPRSLPRRRRPRPDPLTQEEIALMDRIRADRDRVAGALNMDPTLIASRGQLAQIARAPGNLSAILLPWQAGLLAAEPSLAGAAGK